jgi:hypothetical protein
LNSSPLNLAALSFSVDHQGKRSVLDEVISLRLRWHPYLEKRVVDPSTAAWFGVGYYAGCGFLRNRMVFPIHDQEGQLVAYAGRSLDGGEPR